MRLSLDPRVLRLLRRLPRSFPYTVVEIALIALLAAQVARMLWAGFAPAGPLGDWRAAQSVPMNADGALLTRFDPFFRLGGPPGAAVVTGLALKLFGVRVNEGSGRGSAIIATPDGVQNSYAIGDEILPGVKLSAVAFDSVTIDRGGTAEQLFLDQSVAAPVAQANGAAVAVPTEISASALKSEVGFEPRLEKGAVTGFVVSARGSGNAFRAAGLQAGDILTTINGLGIRSVEDVGNALASAPPTGVTTIVVERAGQVITLSAKVGS